MVSALVFWCRLQKATALPPMTNRLTPLHKSHPQFLIPNYPSSPHTQVFILSHHFRLNLEGDLPNYGS